LWEDFLKQSEGVFLYGEKARGLGNLEKGAQAEGLVRAKFPDFGVFWRDFCEAD